MKRTSYQFGFVERRKRKQGPDVWVLRFRVRTDEGNQRHANRRLGTVDELPTRKHAERAAESLRERINGDWKWGMTVAGLIGRYKAYKLPERYSTKASYLSCLNVHIQPRWGEYTLEQLAKAPFEIERWLGGLELAPKTKGHIKGLMHRLFECAMKWAFLPLGRNPMELVEVKDVTKRQHQPRVLAREEFWRLIAHLEEPFRTMVITAQCLGLRVSEVMALKWSDFDFPGLAMKIERGIVHGRVDDLKTAYSSDRLPIDRAFADLMLDWRERSPQTEDGWVFANAATGKPYWQESVLARQIKPAARRAGLGDDVGWHTFRHTYRTWLDGTGASVSIQRDLMRHADIQTTMNIYGRAQLSPEKRDANSRVVEMVLGPQRMVQ